MGRYKKLGRNTLLLTIGNFTQKLMAFFMVPFYTAVLTTAEYGISDLIVTVSNMIWPIFTLLINEAVMRYSLDEDIDKSQVFTIGLATNIIGIFVMVLLSPIILLSSNLKEFYWLFIFYYCSYSIHSLLIYTAKGFKKVKLFSLAGVLNTGLVIIFNILFLLYFNIGITGYLLSFIIGYSLTSIFLLFGSGTYKYLVSFKKPDFYLLKEMYRYSIPMVPNSISWWVSNSSDKLMLTAFCGVAVNGLYSVAYKLPSIISVLSSIFMGAWQISAVEDFGSEESRLFFCRTYRGYSSINLLLTSALITVIKFVAKFLFSKEFYNAWIFGPILIFGAIFHTLSAFLGTIYTSAKKTNMLFYSTLIGALSNIIMNAIMIPIWKGMGAAIATFSSYVIVWIIRAIDSKKIMDIEIDYKKNVILYLIISLQIVITCLDINFATIYSLILFATVLIIERNFVLNVCKYTIQKFRRDR